ncbi:SDR family oxidoreductase [Myxococcota bacterium]|nr:SDR family oxidoreductase [Myxococcota bacterium]
MSGRLGGRVALVTGAGQGVGRGISLALAREGAAVAVAEINAESGLRTVREIEALGGRAAHFDCNVSQRASVEKVVADCVETFGAVDVLVNNAQRAPASPVLLIDHTDEIIDQCFDTGFRGTFYFMQAVYPHMKGRGGRVINLGSASGYQGNHGQAAYGAAKEAIRALSKTAAREWGEDGILVNVICPLASSPGVEKLLELAPELLETFTTGRPLNRIGDCEQDIGPVAVFLASDDSRYVTGHTIAVDGGGAILR